MFKEYDVIRAKRDLSDAVCKGAEGTILIVYQATPPSFEIEFMDKAGESLDVLTVEEEDIEPVETGS